MVLNVDKGLHFSCIKVLNNGLQHLSIRRTCSQMHRSPSEASCKLVIGRDRDYTSIILVRYWKCQMRTWNKSSHTFKAFLLFLMDYTFPCCPLHQHQPLNLSAFQRNWYAQLLQPSAEGSFHIYPKNNEANKTCVCISLSMGWFTGTYSQLNWVILDNTFSFKSISSFRSTNLLISVANPISASSWRDTARPLLTVSKTGKDDLGAAQS